MGTPLYFCPEIWTHCEYSKESDIWALGMILYEMVCEGNLPFPATNIEELEHRILYCDI